MRTYISITLLCLLWIVAGCKTTKQATSVQQGAKASLALKLVMTSGEGKEGDGSNGASVAYHQDQKKWYALFAGNDYFPLCVFDEGGKNISGYVKAGYDARGFWYNSKTKMLEGNGFDEAGILQFPLNAEGIPERPITVFEGGTHQADANSMGAYDNKNDEIIYYFDGEIHRFDRKSGEKVGTWTFKAPLNPYDINESCVIYTGYKKGEIGLLDYHAKKILLFDKNVGTQTGSIELPKDAPTENRFNFAFANGLIWLFDKENRTWMGYKIKN